MLDERSVQTVSTPLNIFKSKGNVVAMSNESLNQFTDLLQYAFNNVERRVQTQMLKPFKRAFMPYQSLQS